MSKSNGKYQKESFGSKDVVGTPVHRQHQEQETYNTVHVKLQSTSDNETENNDMKGGANGE